MKRNSTRGVKILAAVLLLIFVMNVLLFPATVFAAETWTATLTVKQVFTKTGQITPPSETFTYKLTPGQADNPMPANSGANGYIFTVTGTNSINIGQITFTNMGVYTYTINHITSPQPGYIYDQEVYTLMIYVDENRAVNTVVYNKNGEKTPDIKYTHTYRLRPSDPNLMADPPVVKTVSGNPAAISTFTFRLKAENLSNPMPAGSDNGVKTIQIAGSGWGEFGTWSYTEEGTYYYTVSEMNSGAKGYTYDTAVYTITDSVKSADGELVLTRVVTNSSNRQVTSLSFINIYTGDKITYPPVIPPRPPVPPITQQPSTAVPTEPTVPTESTESTQPTVNPPSTEPSEYSTEPSTPLATTNENPGIPSIIIPTDSTPENKPTELPKRNPATGSPKTGDESPTTLYMVFFFTAVIGVMGSSGYLMYDKLRKRRKDL